MDETTLRRLVEDVSRLALPNTSKNISRQEYEEIRNGSHDLEDVKIGTKTGNSSSYRARSSTDGLLDQRRLRKLRLNNYIGRINFFNKRRMSIAMQGDSADF